MPIKKPPIPPISLAEHRALRLQTTVRWAGYWLAAQGALYTLTGDRISALLNLRYQPVMDPYVHLAGITLLCLGFFLLRSLRDARHQYLAVDTLILYFLARFYFLLNHRLAYREVFWFEWTAGLIDATFGGALVWFRTRSNEMVQAGTLLSGSAKELALETRAWVKRQGPPPAITLGELQPPAPGEAPPPPLPTLPDDGSKRKLSEQVPHMD